MNSVALITGGFDPLHSGHLALIKSAKEMSLLVAVGLNSDAWLYRKKGYVFMPFEERKEILESLANVHKVFSFNDSDDTACRAIQVCAWAYPRTRTIIFCNGGDRTEKNIPELGYQPTAHNEPDPIIEFAFGVGGTDKKNSSSALVKVEIGGPALSVREWGSWIVLADHGTSKVKELTVLPGKSLSIQRHFKRSELWFVSEGECTIKREEITKKRLRYHEYFNIPVGSWHSIKNHTDEICKIIEIQYGEKCEETDIERHK